MASNDMRKEIHKRSLGIFFNPFQSRVTDGTENGHDFLGGRSKLQNSLNLLTIKINKIC
jgi:hypothetical protein